MFLYRYLILLAIISCTTSQFVLYTQIGEGFKSYIYQNNSIQSPWKESTDDTTQQQTCKLPRIQLDGSSVQNRTLHFQNTQQSSLQFRVEITNRNPDLRASLSDETFTLQPDQQTAVDVQYECAAGEDNLWDAVRLRVSYAETNSEKDQNSLEFEVMKVCREKSFDPSIVILCLLSILIVWFSAQQSDKPLIIDEEEQTQELGVQHAFLFIIFGSTALVALYYFMDYLQNVLFVLILFSVLSTLNLLLNQFAEDYLLVNFEAQFTVLHEKSCNIPGVGVVTLLNAACFSLSLLIVALYALTRHYMVSNLIAFFMVLSMFKLIRIPNFKVAFALLTLAFFYDIWWVFFSNIVFGQSVMGTVAKNIDLPMKFQCPNLLQHPFQSCSLIGLGDLVLPGVLISYCFRWDQEKKISNWLYFRTSMIGYSLGLSLCMAVLIVYRTGQPALLYLSPFTLIPLSILAISRKEFKNFWNGDLPSRSSVQIPQIEMVEDLK